MRSHPERGPHPAAGYFRAAVEVAGFELDDPFDEPEPDEPELDEPEPDDSEPDPVDDPESEEEAPALSFRDDPSPEEPSEDDEDSAPEDSEPLLLPEDPDAARESLR